MKALASLLLCVGSWVACFCTDTLGNAYAQAPSQDLSLEVIEHIKALASEDLERAVHLADSIAQLPMDEELEKAYYETISLLAARAHEVSLYGTVYTYAHQCLSYYDSASAPEAYLDNLLRCAQTQVFLGGHEEAATLLEKCKKILLATPERNKGDDLISTLTHQGIMYAMQNNTTGAIRCFLSADSLCEAYQNYGAQVAIPGYMGNVYSMTGQYEKALEYQKRSRDLCIATNNNSMVLAACDNIANALLGLERFEEALEALEEGRTYGSEIENSVDMATNYSITADVLTHLKRFEEGRNYLKKAIELHRKANNEYGEVQAMRTLTQLYQEEGNHEKAIETGKELVKISWNPQRLDSRTTVHYLLWASYDSLHNMERAYHHCMWYYWLRDSTTRQKFNTTVARLQEDFDSELKLSEIELLKEQATLAEVTSAQKDAFTTFLAIGAGLVILVLLVLIYFFRLLRKSRSEVMAQRNTLEKSDAEKAILLKELHHRVKNNLQIVSSLLNLQSNSVTDEIALKAFKEGQNRVDAMAMIHKHLYNTDELTSVDISSYLERLIRSLAFSYGFNKTNFRLVADISKKPMDVDVAIPLGLIVNELVSNTFKHAFTDTEMAEITIAMQYDGQVTALLLKDNGKGLPQGFSVDNSASFGLELVQTLVHQLKGKIRFENNNGAMFAIEIDHTKTEAA